MGGSGGGRGERRAGLARGRGQGEREKETDVNVLTNFEQHRLARGGWGKLPSSCSFSEIQVRR